MNYFHNKWRVILVSTIFDITVRQKTTKKWVKHETCNDRFRKDGWKYGSSIGS